jgi:hypothetical protein
VLSCDSRPASSLASEDQDHHPERTGVTPAARQDLDWMDDVLDWDTKPADDDPCSDDEPVTPACIATLPEIAKVVTVTGGSVTKAACRHQIAGIRTAHDLGEGLPT